MLNLIFITQKVFFTILIATILSSCNSKKENFDIDISTLKSTKLIKKADESKKITFDLENNSYIQDLVAPKNKEQILSNTKFGKKDPFSKSETKNNKLHYSFGLRGFLNTEDETYVFVSYLDNEGAITEASIGGLNTNLLPNGAKVLSIDPINLKLTINFKNENYIFELK